MPDKRGQTEAEQIKRELYREWWVKRAQATINKPRINYSQRFAEMHGETLEQYHARLAHITLLDN